eukprot:TRINITY_DN8280_c0_g1_i1.p1 TRINITY_DN8280_c0_g1~~TRINITY_DN8280_c0_g1_i1.p1  ORF type:complete len:565 (-),score=161.04 TRINITY_DN8280_c0_g1_i1:77-1771(-)
MADYFERPEVRSILDKMDQYLEENTHEDVFEGMKQFLATITAPKVSLPGKPEEKKFERRMLSEFEVTEYKEVFDEFDKDRSGFIELGELEDMSRRLGSKLTEEETKSAMIALDKDNDGKVCFDEFLEWWTSDKKLGGVGGLKLKWIKAKYKLQSVEKKLAGAGTGKKAASLPPASHSNTEDDVARGSWSVAIGDNPVEPKTSVKISVMNATPERRQAALEKAGSIYGERFFAAAVINLKEPLTEELQQFLSYGPVFKCGRVTGEPTKAVLHLGLVPKEVKAIFNGITVDSPVDIDFAMHFERDVFDALRGDPPRLPDLLDSARIEGSTAIHKDIINVLKSAAEANSDSDDDSDDETAISKILPRALKGPNSYMWAVQGILDLFLSTHLHLHFGSVTKMLDMVMEHAPETAKDEDAGSDSGSDSDEEMNAAKQISKGLAKAKELRKMALEKIAESLFRRRSKIWRKGPTTAAAVFYGYNTARRILGSLESITVVSPFAIGSVECSIPLLGSIDAPTLHEFYALAQEKDVSTADEEDIQKAFSLCDSRGFDLFMRLKDKVEAEMFS